MRKEETVFLEYLKQNHLRYTPERKTILEVFLKTEKHLSLDELCYKVQKVRPGINYTTTYRNLKVLAQIGLAREWKGADKKTYFEHNYEHQHHDHMFCLKCGKVIEFFEPGLEKLQEKIAKRLKFRVSEHQLAFYGQCEKCQGGKNEIK